MVLSVYRYIVAERSSHALYSLVYLIPGTLFSTYIVHLQVLRIFADLAGIHNVT